MPDDHRQGPRRRGDTLYAAIYEATMTELAEVGYDGLTMESVARRAGASKASLYRRWSNRIGLVRDAARDTIAQITTYDDLPDTGAARTDLIELFGRVTRRLQGPLGEAVRGMLLERLRGSAGAEDEPDDIRLLDARPTPVLDILQRGADRGEVRPGAVTPLIARVVPSILRQHFLAGVPITDDLIAEVVDEVLLPILRPCPDSPTEPPTAR